MFRICSIVNTTAGIVGSIDVSDAARSHQDERGVHRQVFADRMIAHRLCGVQKAASDAGYTRFEIARAILHFAVEEMMVVGRDPEVLDAALEEAIIVAEIINGRDGV